MGAVSTKKRLPSIFVAGFPKAGTTTLHRMLVRSGATQATVKEPSVLLLDRPNLDDVISAYSGYFPVVEDGPLIDGSPYYIYDERAIDRMSSLGSATHVLISVRDPWQRVCSAYLDQFTKGYERRSLQRALEGQLSQRPKLLGRAERSASREYVAGSCYGEYVSRLLESPLREAVRLVALESFDDQTTRDALSDWTDLSIAAEWSQENSATPKTSAMPALVHGVAQHVGSMMPSTVHSRLAPLAKPAMAKLASVPLPTGKKPDLEVDAQTKRAADEILHRSIDGLRDLPSDLWLGPTPAWLDRQTVRDQMLNLSALQKDE